MVNPLNVKAASNCDVVAVDCSDVRAEVGCCACTGLDTGGEEGKVDDGKADAEVDVDNGVNGGRADVDIDVGNDVDVIGKDVDVVVDVSVTGGVDIGVDVSVVVDVVVDVSGEVVVGVGSSDKTTKLVK